MKNWWNMRPIIAPLPKGFMDYDTSRKEAVEWMNRAADQLDGFQERIDNAAKAAFGTHASWENRCHAIMTALGLGFDYTPLPTDVGIRLIAKIVRAGELIARADKLREAQRAYLVDRGNEEKGRAVGEAAAAYDKAREWRWEDVSVTATPAEVVDALLKREERLTRLEKAVQELLHNRGEDYLHIDDRVMLEEAWNGEGGR